MTVTMKTGKFITIDGPHGVGKTTLIRLVCECLHDLCSDVLKTKEPTSAFNRANEEKHGLELARLIIEDRRQHLADEIEPALKRDMCVVCDRYVESSLVYRKLDGISFYDTWIENSSFQIPDMSILLIASVPTLEERLKDRKILSRFEREHTRAEELSLYQEAHGFLGGRGFKSVVVENERFSPEKVAKQITELITRIG